MIQAYKYPAGKIKEIANTLRQDVLLMLYAAGSGHTAGSLGMADVFATLYFHTLRYDPKKPKDPARDFVILSNGHICPILYATLAEAGYFPKKELGTLRQLGSRLQGHPHRGSLPGIENSSGPLGQGLSYAAGLALALKRGKKKNHVFCLASDGEHDEGQAWESALFAAKYALNNLTVILDRNHIQIDGSTNNVMPLRSIAKKYEAFNWNVIRVDGHAIPDIIKSLGNAMNKKNAPTLIIADTVPGKGVKAFENDHYWHGKAPNEEQTAKALDELRERGKKRA